MRHPKDGVHDLQERTLRCRAPHGRGGGRKALIPQGGVKPRRPLQKRPDGGVKHVGPAALSHAVEGHGHGGEGVGDGVEGFRQRREVVGVTMSEEVRQDGRYCGAASLHIDGTDEKPGLVGGLGKIEKSRGIVERRGEGGVGEAPIVEGNVGVGWNGRAVSARAMSQEGRPESCRDLARLC
jgi:hypothetical protein